MPQGATRRLVRLPLALVVGRRRDGRERPILAGSAPPGDLAPEVTPDDRHVEIEHAFAFDERAFGDEVVARGQRRDFHDCAEVIEKARNPALSLVNIEDDRGLRSDHVATLASVRHRFVSLPQRGSE